MRTLIESRDARAGLVALALGLVYLAFAFTIEPDPSTTSVLGPQVAPIVIGIATVACALALVVQAIRRPDVQDATSGAESQSGLGDDAPPAAGAGVNQRQVVVMFGLFAAYVVAFIPLGYLLSTFLFLVAMTTYVDRKKLLRNCIFAAVFSPAVFVLFDYGLKVQLPAPGLLG
ncbi:MAG: tripartite tricarboxylate transporter TctB family protein [Nocardioidaceae bacterium]